jgi:hypothetical protein
MRNFISAMEVKVLSLFEAKPRKRKYEIQADNRIAFRVCIDREDQDRLLDDSAWPSYVSVSNWFFKSKQQDDIQPPVVAEVHNVESDHSSPVAILLSSTINNADEDMDATIIHMATAADLQMQSTT